MNDKLNESESSVTLAEGDFSSDEEQIEDANYNGKGPCDLKEYGVSLEEDVYTNFKYNLGEEPSGSLIFQILKNLNPRELMQFKAPIMFTRSVSLIEDMSNLLQPSEEMLSINSVEDDATRMLYILKFWIKSASIFVANSLVHFVPYNPVIGEVFKCKWQHADSETYYLSEQVSHHPPIHSICTWNEKAGYRVDVTTKFAPKLKMNKIEIGLNGFKKVHLTQKKETYFVDLCKIACKGLIFGKLQVSLDGECKIKCEETKCELSINFDKTDVKGQISKNGKQIFSISGDMNDKVQYTDSRNNSTNVLVDYSSGFTESLAGKKIIKPVPEQAPNESRRHWHTATVLIRKKELDKASKAKNALEDFQRRLKKEREEKDMPFVPVLFKKMESKDEEESLNYAYKGEATKAYFNKV